MFPTVNDAFQESVSYAPLNHPETTISYTFPPAPWENCLSQSWCLLPESSGSASLEPSGCVQEAVLAVGAVDKAAASILGKTLGCELSSPAVKTDSWWSNVQLAQGSWESGPLHGGPGS